jgi:excisionase family DNA binding protein
MMTKRLYKPAEACELLNISRKTLGRWIDAGKIEVTRLPGDSPNGNRYRIPARELKRLGVELNGK